MAYNHDQDDESGMAGDPGAVTRETKATTPPKPPQMFTVPANAEPAVCACGNARLYWIRTEAGRKMQVDVGVEGGMAPMRAATTAQREKFALTADEGRPRDGCGVSHFVTCPRAGEFRRKR